MSSAINRAFKKESGEHPEFSPKQIWAIVRDHYKQNGDESNSKLAQEKFDALSEQTEKSVEKFAELKGVEIFMAGKHLGETYTEDDVKELAENTNTLLEMGKHEPPAKLGHSEDQKVAEEEGLPAVGWVERVYCEGNRLLADFKQVPNLVAEAIGKGLYRHVSSEIYWPKATAEYFGEFGVKGKVLRAVAFLGADVPVVKGLKPLMLHYSNKGGFKVATLQVCDKKIMAHSEPDGDEKDKKPLMVPANRHPIGALVKMKGNDETHQVMAAHPDGSYNVGQLHDPTAPVKTQVTHENLTLLSEQDAQGYLAKLSERLKLGTTEKASPTEDKMDNTDAVKLAEDKAAEAIKLAKSEKAKRIALENERTDERIAAFAEKHKTVITPALKPAFEALAKTQAGTVKLAEKEVSFLDAFLSFAEQFVAAKPVITEELAPETKPEDVTDKVKLAEQNLKDTQSARSGNVITGADLAVEARAYSEKTGKSYRDALIAVSASHKSNEGGK